MPSFTKSVTLPAPPGEAFSWHARPGAFERLTPYWEAVRVVSRTGDLTPGNVVHFKIKNGPVWMDWVARHTEYEEGVRFQDQQIKGPFSAWRHTHSFTPEGSGTRLTDHIDYALPLAPLGSLFGGPMVRKRLNTMFGFRHRVTRWDMETHARYGLPPLHLGITGASGLLGRSLVPFLTTAGHRVTRIVRHNPEPGADQALWDPDRDLVNLDPLAGADAVIHLAGENIGEGRWTREKLTRVIRSRLHGTATLVRGLARLNPPPKVLISASAVGYYGDRGDRELTEADGPGRGFVAELCRDWETAALAAEAAGMRVVILRIGVVTTPAGGALQKVLLPTRLGMGTWLGRGNQFLSWVGPEDVFGAVLHAIGTESLTGPVNLVAPQPATSREWTKAIARAFGRNARFGAPEAALRAVFGQMADEILLASARVIPQKLLDTGYEFRNPDLDGLLSHVLPVEDTP